MTLRTASKHVLQSLFPRATAHCRAYNSLIRDRNSYLYQTGWMQSLQGSIPVDSKARPIPWMNFSVIKLLDDRLKEDFQLFEFGSGYSTCFYAQRVAAVTSVEYDAQWLEIVKAQVPKNVRLIFKPKDADGEYCRVIGGMGKQFDVVVVDGRDRVNCVKHAIPALTGRGVVLLDDSQRDRYQEGIGFAKKMGFRALDLEGLKATGNGLDRTTVLYRDGNCLGI
jgi:hypothetical protein